MRLSISNPQLLLVIAATASANPVARPTNALEKRINCNQVNAVLGVLKVLGEPATTFCSSYLRIPATATRTTTITPAVVYVYFTLVLRAKLITK
jgi:hypothetical protein